MITIIDDPNAPDAKPPGERDLRTAKNVANWYTKVAEMGYRASDHIHCSLQDMRNSEERFEGLLLDHKVHCMRWKERS